MPLAIAPEVPYITAAADDRIWQQTGYGSAVGPLDSDIIMRTRLDELKFGRDRYPLWRSTVGRLLPEPQSNRYRFQLDGLFTIAGEGDSPQQAMKSFREEFHARFQDLLTKRPFEMTAEEKRTWDEIRRIVNVELYRREIPMLMRQFGEVLSERTGHRAVHWEGSGKERVDLEKFPGEFASFHVGQPFEAYLERDQQTMQINRVLSVRRTIRPSHHAAADNRNFSASLKSNKELPPASLD